MNPFVRQLHLGIALALSVVLSPAVLAQEPPAPAEKSPPAATPAPAAVPERSPDAAPPLRRLDEAQPENKSRSAQRMRTRHGPGFPFGDHLISKDNRVGDVVSIMGSSTVEGEVIQDAVSIGGNTFVGPGAIVGSDAVAVFGRVTVQGRVKGEVVSVLGGAKVNGRVGRNVVAVLGNLDLGPDAVIEGDIVIIGGRLTKDPKAEVHGDEVYLPFFGDMGHLDWLVTWITRCAMWGRMLAFDDRLAWAWAVALGFVAFYTLLSFVFRGAIDRCAQTLITRPGKTLLSSILTALLLPIATALLCVIVIGIPVVPFLFMAILCGTLFGKAVMLACIGRPFTRLFGDGPLGHTAVSVFVGGMLVMLLYTVPVLGGLLFKLLGWLGLGAVTYTLLLASRREKLAAAAAGPVAARPVPPPSASAPTTMAFIAPAVAATPRPMSVSGGFSGSGIVAAEIPATAEVVPPPIAPAPLAPLPVPTVQPVRPVSTPPAVPVAWERAGFFIRLGALAIDGVLIGMIVGFASSTLPRFLSLHDGPGGVLIALAIYGAVMWKTKGTTIGGIICGLKVVRADQREIDWATAIVRALGCFLSLAVAGLGFIWVAFDDDKQSWHDKIAGTTIVRVPKGTALL